MYAGRRGYKVITCIMRFVAVAQHIWGEKVSWGRGQMNIEPGEK